MKRRTLQKRLRDGIRGICQTLYQKNYCVADDTAYKDLARVKMDELRRRLNFARKMKPKTVHTYYARTFYTPPLRKCQKIIIIKEAILVTDISFIQHNIK